jgi:hypothetical protein
MGLNKNQTNKTSFKKGQVPWNKNFKGYKLNRINLKTLPKEIREKISIATKKGMSKIEVKNRLSEKAKRNAILGLNKSIFKKGHLGIRGEKNIMWKGGISFEHYSVDWTNTLKQAIRQRDKYTCKICGREGLQVHHIDYNKKNCETKNLITLCKPCHMKTNFNREKWIKYFREIQDLLPNSE